MKAAQAPNEAPNEVGHLLFLGRSCEEIILAPRKIESYSDFIRAIRKIRAATGTIAEEDDNQLVHAVCYLLAWIVGDASKHLGSRRWLTMNLVLHLTRKHPENLLLGEYVMDCLRMLGVPCMRGQDGEPTRKVPNGFYSWHSRFSPIVGWLFTACLGLGWDEKTTKHPVKMEWLLGAPQDPRVWFLRGLADSDGDVHFQQRWVDIATSPNTNFIQRLYESLGLHARVRVHRGYGYVSISANDAAKLQIFNPNLLTYRRATLEKLVAARVFHNRWPDWLEAKVQFLIREGLSERRICELVLEEDTVYVRMRSIKAKRKKIVAQNSVGEMQLHS